MKRTKNYVTLPGYIMIPKAAKKMVIALKETYSKNDENYFYRLLKNEIDQGRLKTEALGTSGRVKQVKETDIDDIIQRFKSGKELQKTQNQTKETNSSKILSEIINVIKLYENGRIDPDEALKIIKNILR